MALLAAIQVGRSGDLLLGSQAQAASSGSLVEVAAGSTKTVSRWPGSKQKLLPPSQLSVQPRSLGQQLQLCKPPPKQCRWMKGQQAMQKSAVVCAGLAEDEHSFPSWQKVAAWASIGAGSLLSASGARALASGPSSASRAGKGSGPPVSGGGEGGAGGGGSSGGQGGSSGSGGSGGGWGSGDGGGASWQGNDDARGSLAEASDLSEDESGSGGEEVYYGLPLASVSGALSSPKPDSPSPSGSPVPSTPEGSPIEATDSPASATSARGTSPSAGGNGGKPPPVDQLLALIARVFYALTGGRRGDSPRSRDGEPLAVPMERQALIEDTAELVLKLLGERAGEEALARRSEVGALRRLQREAFSDLLKLRERVEGLDVRAGLAGEGRAGTRLTGEVTAGAAFLPAAPQQRHEARAALEQAGMRSGLTAKFRFETPCRERDVLLTECTAGLGEASSAVMLGGPLVLHKLLYTARLLPGLVLRLAPMGARGGDLLDTLNPLQDKGLTRFASGGPPLLGHAQGSAIGLSLHAGRASLSAGHFLSGWGMTPSPEAEAGALCSSTLAHLALQPHDRLWFGFSALNRVWPSPPLPSAGALHWSEMGPLVLPQLQLLPRKLPPPAANGSATAGPPEPSSVWDLPQTPAGTALQSISVSGALGLGSGTTLAAWAQAEHAGWLAEDDRGEMQWAVSLAHGPGGGKGSHVWGLSVGSGQAAEAAEEGPAAKPLQMEAFVRLRCGKGLVLQPGAVLTREGERTHQALMLRSTWAL